MGLGAPKQFTQLDGVPMLVHTIRAFEQLDAIGLICVAAPQNHLDETRSLLKKFQLTKTQVVAGGKLRQDSVKAGLSHIPPEYDLVAVHDGARPLVSPDLIGRCLAKAAKTGAAMAAIPVKDTLKEVGKDLIIRRTIDREHLWQAQTPQVVRTDILKNAFAVAEKQSFIGTDEASFLELIDVPMSVVEGSEKNIKITRPDDLVIAQAILMKKDNQPILRTGHGYDAHRLVENRELILGGVTIPHATGLLGHSDADVLTHALCDALLGALAEGDIGKHFPDSDPAFKNISSLKLLENVMSLVRSKGYRLLNADITIIAQKPKLSPHFPAMKKNLSKACQADQGAINLKGTTTEKMGFAGRQEGIAAHAVVLLQTA